MRPCVVHVKGYLFILVSLDTYQKDKDGNIIMSSPMNFEGLNEETTYILISDAQTKVMHPDTCLSKASPLKYLELFLEKYSPNDSKKFFVLDQGGGLYHNHEVLNLF